MCIIWGHFNRIRKSCIWLKFLFINCIFKMCVCKSPILKFITPYKSTKCPVPNQASESSKDHFKKCTSSGNTMTVFNSSPFVWGSPRQRLQVILKSAVDDRCGLQSLQSGQNGVIGLGHTVQTRMMLSIYPTADGPSEFLMWRPMMPNASTDLELQRMFSLTT